MPELANTYCQAILNGSLTEVHTIYHDTAYGFPIQNDDELFCRLILEINQAGLSWTTILNKQEHFRMAYDGFSIQAVAAYTDEDRHRLMQDAGIIRNRLKIDAAIHNAKVILSLKEQYGSFGNWLRHQHPLNRQEWTKLFKKTFKFTGGEIVNEFLMSIGYLPGAHDPGCPVYKRVLEHNPPWVEAVEK